MTPAADASPARAALDVLAATVPGLPELDAVGAAAFYAIVWGIVFVESGLLVGFFLPGDTLLFTAGLLAADAGRGVSVTVLVLGVVVAAVTGDSVGYAIGRRGGRPLIERREGKRLGPEELARAERFFERFGALSVVAARWVPWVRTAVPVLAGASHMPYAQFLVANVVGALAWGVTLPVLGAYAAEVPALRDAALVVAVVVVLLTVGAGVVRAVRDRRRQQGST